MVIQAFHPGKVMVKITTVQVAVNDLLEVRPPESVWPFEPLLADLNRVSGLRLCRRLWTLVRHLQNQMFPPEGKIDGLPQKAVKSLVF